MTDSPTTDSAHQRADTSHYYLDEQRRQLPRAWQLCRVFVDASWRERFDALMLLNLECRHLLRDIAEPAVLSVRLDFWQREWASAQDQDPHHPITVCLGQAQLPDIAPALEGLYQFITAAAPETHSDYRQRLRPLASFLAELEAAIDPLERSVTDSEVQLWDTVLSAQMVLDLPQLCARQRSVLPLDLLARHELNPYAAQTQTDRVVALWQSLMASDLPPQTDAYGGLLAAASRRLLNRSLERPQTLYDPSGSAGRFSDLWAIWRQARAIRRARAQTARSAGSHKKDEPD